MTHVSLSGSYFSTDQNPCSGLEMRKVFGSVSSMATSKIELAVTSSGSPIMTQAR